MTILGSVLDDFADYHDWVLTIKVGVVHEKCLAQEEYTQTVRTFLLENLEGLMVLPAHGYQTLLSFFTVWYQAMFSLCKTRAAFMSVRKNLALVPTSTTGSLSALTASSGRRPTNLGAEDTRSPM